MAVANVLRHPDQPVPPFRNTVYDNGQPRPATQLCRLDLARSRAGDMRNSSVAACDGAPAALAQIQPPKKMLEAWPGSILPELRRAHTAASLQSDRRDSCDRLKGQDRPMQSLFSLSLHQWLRDIEHTAFRQKATCPLQSLQDHLPPREFQLHWIVH